METFWYQPTWIVLENDHETSIVVVVINWYICRHSFDTGSTSGGIHYPACSSPQTNGRFSTAPLRISLFFMTKNRLCRHWLGNFLMLLHWIRRLLTFVAFIPVYGRCVVSQALETSIHPLAQLTDSLVDAFLATYVGIGSHLRLLLHAVDEFKSFVTRLYLIIRWSSDSVCMLFISVKC